MIEALLSMLYLQGGAAYYVTAPTPASRAYGLSPYDRQRNYNPYATLAVGLESPARGRWSFSLEARHVSSVVKNDWGDNSVVAQFKFTPFRRNQ